MQTTTVRATALSGFQIPQLSIHFLDFDLNICITGLTKCPFGGEDDSGTAQFNVRHCLFQTSHGPWTLWT